MYESRSLFPELPVLHRFAPIRNRFCSSTADCSQFSASSRDSAARRKFWKTCPVPGTRRTEPVGDDQETESGMICQGRLLKD